ncbi:MAG TPA: 3-oxoacyl-ACP synthase III [Candidatus Wallbacteria bacterium]|nr:3-oxoacyl-ACP synthase III [Candidatus Wallbacteria bacterium]
MLYRRVCLEAFGYEIPECVVTSENIESRLAPLYEKLKLPSGRLEMMTGIRERRLWPKGVKPSDASTRAGKQAIERAGIDPSQLECLIHSSVSRDFLEPATATVVHNNLGLPKSAMVFDISNACLGFLNAMLTAANMIELGQIKSAIVVAGESAGMLVEKTIEELNSLENPTRNKIKDSFPSLTIGSGAVALVMTDISISKSKHRLLGGTFRAATMHNNLCQGSVESADAGFANESNMPHMCTNAEALLVSGCELARENWDDFQRELNWTAETPERVFCHQVGSMHRRAVYQSLALDMNKDFSTFEVLGNVGSVSLPITLAIACDQGLVSKGDNIAMLGIGSGINSIMLGVEW